MQCRCGTFLYSSIDKDWMKVEILANSLKALKGKTFFQEPRPEEQSQVEEFGDLDTEVQPSDPEDVTEGDIV